MYLNSQQKYGHHGRCSTDVRSFPAGKVCWQLNYYDHNLNPWRQKDNALEKKQKLFRTGSDVVATYYKMFYLKYV